MRTIYTAVLLMGILSCARASAADVAYAVQVVPSPSNKLKHTTEKYDDVLTISGKKFSSKVSSGYGFPDGECTEKKEGARPIITVELKDEKHGTNKYELTIQGDKIAGTLKWSKPGEDGKPKTAEYTITGSVKK
jgi:hypothetical protein